MPLMERRDTLPKRMREEKSVQLETLTNTSCLMTKEKRREESVRYLTKYYPKTGSGCVFVVVDDEMR